MTDPIRIFISYSHKDQELKDCLLEHLCSLQREGLVSIWHDRQIDAGQSWARDIDNNLEVADIILLLISPSFLSSDYCYGVELERALERQSNGQARLIPILLRPVDWGRSTLKTIQALPANGRSVTQWSNQDEAFQTISVGIRNVVSLLASSSSNLPVLRSVDSHPDDGEDVKYYLYISDGKVDMLFPQISLATRLEAGRTLGISDGRPLVDHTEVDRATNRLFKLRSGVRFLKERARVGTIDDPQEYFAGIADIYWGNTHSSTAAMSVDGPYIYFSGTTERTNFLLSASSKYLVSGYQPRHVGFSSSSIPHVIDALIAEIDVWGTTADSRPLDLEASDRVANHERNDLPYTGTELALDLVDMAPLHLSGARQRLEFLAKTLLRGPSPRYGVKTNILGSPLYVALAA